jgi:hypothetical protein
MREENWSSLQMLKRIFGQNIEEENKECRVIRSLEVYDMH